jgi:flagellar hook-basal body complex protein FliE
MTLPISAVTSQATQWAVPKTSGGQWSVGSLEGTEGGGAAPGTEAPGGSFGSMLTNAIGDLQKTQETASVASTELATGKTEDLSSVITAVQEASLSMELASQVRNKAVEAYTELFHTQI